MAEEEEKKVRTTTGLAMTDTKERRDAQEAKEEADPAVNDPTGMPNIEPQTGDGDE
jgi:hypothetical protein